MIFCQEWQAKFFLVVLGFAAVFRNQVYSSPIHGVPTTRGIPISRAVPGGWFTDARISNAFFTASQKLKVPLKTEVKEPFSKDEMNDLGVVLEETARILAQECQLDYRAVAELFSRGINTLTTDISKYCPIHLQNKLCKVTKYREMDGSCNNLESSQWGSANTAFTRFIPSAYGDGISTPRLSSTGQELPSSRLISNLVHPEDALPERGVSLFFVGWGQFLAHDTLSAAETTGITCCQGPDVNNPSCLPINIPQNDPFYSRFRQTCMEFKRSRSGVKDNCKLGNRQQLNQISSVIDGNTVYSNDAQTLRKLRTFIGGEMKTLPAFSHLGLKDLLPLKLENPDQGCIRHNSSVNCFMAGEPRVNEHSILVSHHLLMLREHNRLAKELALINPHWTDETIFQETRHIVAALNQHITLKEYVPLVVGGQKGLHTYGLTSPTHGYYTGYDKNINPSIATEFSTAAFRFGHSLIPSLIERWSQCHQLIGKERLSGMLLQPFNMLKPGYADEYLVGMLNQPGLAMGDSMSTEVTEHLFERPDGPRFGMDLASLNIQRGRDHGIPSFNRWREWCGLKPVRTWTEAAQIFTKNSSMWYSRIYKSPEDIDLWSGGLSEVPEHGSLLGPTFSCILGRQFYNLRAGDRFWYENPGWPSSFTPPQLNQIRQYSLARLICDNSDGVKTIQRKAMLLPDPQINPRVHCAQIPKLDISYWRDQRRK